MRTLVLGLTVPCLVLLTLCSVERPEASSVQRLFAFHSRLEPLCDLKAGVQMKMRFTFWPGDKLKYVQADERVTVSVSPVNLNYSGPLEWTVPLPSLDSHSTIVEIEIPYHDTSGVFFEITSGEAKERAPFFFVSIRDTVGMITGDPRGQIPLARGYTPAEGDSIAGEEVRRQLDSIAKLPKAQYNVHRSGGMAGVLSHEDSIWMETLSESDRYDLRVMRAKETRPHRGDRKDVMTIDGRRFERSPGEQYFREVEVTLVRTEDRLVYTQRIIDSANVAKNQDYDITIHLRNVSDSEFVVGLVDSLIPTDSAGYYRAIVKWGVIMELRESGLEWSSTREDTGERRLPRDSSAQKKKRTPEN